MGKRGTDECQPYACQIQACLQKNNYQQDACQSAIEAMLDCCDLHESKNFSSCDGFKFLLRKRIEEKKKKQDQTPNT